MLYLWLAAIAWSAELRLVANPSTLQQGQTGTLELQLVDGNHRGMPDVPTPDGLQLSYQGQSSEHVVVNFKSTKTVRYRYALTAIAEGTHVIGPLELRVADGTTARAPAIQIKVLPRSADDPSGVVVTLSDANPWAGQVVLYHLKFRTTGQVSDTRWTAPDFDGFVQEQTADGTKASYMLEEDGDPITVQEITIPLVAAGVGKQTISPSAIQAQFPVRRKRRSRGGFDHLLGFTEVENKTFASDPLDVDIRALPPPPPEYSGLVGAFTVVARPQQGQVPLGESVTVDVLVQGTGTLSGFKLPTIPQDAPYRVYDDDPAITASVTKDGVFVARAQIKRAVVPESEGSLTIPPISLSAFDPVSGEYVTVSSDPISIRVTPGEGDGGEISSFATGVADARQDVESLGDDILPAPGDIRVRDRRLANAALGLVALPALPLAVLGVLLMGERVKRREVKPWVLLDQRLANLPAEPTSRLASLEDIFREACGIRLGVPPAGLDRQQVSALGKDAVVLYETLERARYGGGAIADIEADVRKTIAGRGST